MKLELNGKEVEIDLLDADTFENYEKAIQSLQDLKKVNENNPGQFIRSYCQKVYFFFDTLLGEGSAQTIFNGKNNMRICNECLQKCFSACTDYLSNAFAKDVDELLTSWEKFIP